MTANDCGETRWEEGCMSEEQSKAPVGYAVPTLEQAKEIARANLLAMTQDPEVVSAFAKMAEDGAKEAFDNWRDAFDNWRDASEADLLAEVCRRAVAGELSEFGVGLIYGVFFEQDTDEETDVADVVKRAVAGTLSPRSVAVLLAALVPEAAR